jgi:hypothetical protein
MRGFVNVSCVSGAGRPLADVFAAFTVRRRRARVIVGGMGHLAPAQIPFRFHQGHFLKARSVLKVRPHKNDPNLDHTDERYCVYDGLNDNYGYTPRT